MHTQMAIQYARMGRQDQAKAQCRLALALDSADLSALRLLAKICRDDGDADELAKLLGQALALDSPDARILFDIGAGLRDCGRLHDARKAFALVLVLEPEHSGAYYNLAIMTRYTEHDPEVAAMESVYSKSKVRTRKRRQLAFALGKVFDDLGEYDKAFDYFREGNRIAYSRSGHSINNDRAWFAGIISTFDSEFFKRYSDVGQDDTRPIIIAGLPRSGTTLTEQILATHPMVQGLGEAPIISSIADGLAAVTGQPFPKGLNHVPDAALEDAARRCAEALKNQSQDDGRVANKAITNFLKIGLICVMLPNATIVEIKRDPRDQGLSLFQKDLHLQLFGYDLEAIGVICNLYSELMAHWKKCLPSRIFTIHYEQLVTNPDEEIRRLLDHCGLPFDASCLSFHQTERSVHTVSLSQVRQPAYQSSIGRWKNYERHLAPLLQALDSKPF